MSQQKHQQKIDRPAADLLPAVIESLLFVAVEPQEIATIAKSLNVPKRDVDKAVEMLIGATEGRGVFVQRLGDSVQMATVPDAGPYIERFLEVDHGRLSRASLETLAIIAYRSPMTRATIESIRGVNSDYSVATLVARGLVEEVGRAPGPGRSVLFASTHRFLEYFGLQRTEDLPPLAELDQTDLEAAIPADLLADGAEAEADADQTSADQTPADGPPTDEADADEPDVEAAIPAELLADNTEAEAAADETSAGETSADGSPNDAPDADAPDADAPSGEQPEDAVAAAVESEQPVEEGSDERD